MALPTQCSSKVKFPPRLLSSVATVQELVLTNFEGGRLLWNEKTIDEIFWAEEAMTIKNIPLGSSERGDIPIWSLTEKGIFVVNSAYRFALTLQDQLLGKTSYIQEDTKL